MTDAQPQTKRHQVLIVDDDEGIRQMLGIALEDEGYEVSTAESGEDALAFLSHTPVDLVISDMRMPNGDGAYLLDAVRDQSPELPMFILMSGFTDLTPEEALARGANAFFHKPYRLDELLEEIESELGPPPDLDP